MDIFDPDKPRYAAPDSDPGVKKDGRKPLHPAARGINWLIDMIRYRMMFVWGIMLLAIALAVLTPAWQEFSGQKQSILDSLTEHGTVKVLDTSVCILPQNNPETKLDPGRALWHHDFVFEHVLEMSYQPTQPVKAYRSDHSRDFVDIGAFWSTLEKEPLFRTPQLNIKMETGIYKLLTGTPAQAGVPFKILDAPKDAPKEERYKMGSQFDQLWVWIDRPIHALALAWLSDSGNSVVPVRFDPNAPENFLFEEQFRNASKSWSRFPVLVGAIFLTVFGLVILSFAVTMLTHGMSKYIWAILYIGIVVMIPFGSHHLKSAVDYFGLPEIGKFFVDEWYQSMDARSRVGFLEAVPDNGKQAFTILPIDTAHSRYQDVFSYFQLKRGTAHFDSFDEAMQAISAQLTEQIINMPTKDQFRFFKILDNHMNQRRAGWAAPFLEGTKAIALDGNRSKNLRSWAISVLCDMCGDLEDPKLAEMIYQQYVNSHEEVKPYWRRYFWNYYQAPGFIADLNSQDPVRIKRALEIWANSHHFLEDVQFLAPRLQQLMSYPDPEIRKMATEKWNSRKDWLNK